MTKRTEVIFFRSDKSSAPKRKTQEYLRHRGCEGVNLPLLQIEIDYDALTTTQNRESLLKPDWLVFLSAKAAQILLASYLPAKQCKIAAIGKSTAHMISQYKISADIISAIPENSTTLYEALNNSIDNDFQKYSWVICCGHDGNQTLAKAISQEGAQVTELKVYRRKKRDLGTIKTNFIHKLTDGKIKAFCFTSCTSIKFFLEEFGLPREDIMIVVASKRINDYALLRGIGNAVVAVGADDQSLCNAIFSGKQEEQEGE